MRLPSWKRPADKSEADRQLVIAYKKVFMSEEGRIVFSDLANRYHLLSGHKGDLLKEGQREVILHILTQREIDLAAFERILKGEL